MALKIVGEIDSNKLLHVSTNVLALNNPVVSIRGNSARSGSIMSIVGTTTSLVYNSMLKISSHSLNRSVDDPFTFFLLKIQRMAR